MCELKERIKEVNASLLSCEPSNITTDHKGYSGYTPQSVVDSMNVILFGRWGFEELENEQASETEKSVTFVSKVRVWLIDESGEKIPFQPTAWGEGTQPLSARGDVKKSAFTDGLKKALSYFSVGNRAYHGKLSK